MAETVVNDKSSRPMVELASPAERLWTPVLGGSGGESGQVYGLQRGHWNKVGRMVWVMCYIILSTKGVITGNVVIKGLPFPLDTSFDANMQPSLNVGWFANLLVNKVWLGAVVLGGASGDRVALYGLNAAGISPAALATADIDNTTNIQVAGWYPTPV